MALDGAQRFSKLRRQGVDRCRVCGFLAGKAEVEGAFGPFGRGGKAKGAERQGRSFQLMGEVANRPHLRLWFGGERPHSVEQVGGALAEHLQKLALQTRVARCLA